MNWSAPPSSTSISPSPSPLTSAPLSAPPSASASASASPAPTSPPAPAPPSSSSRRPSEARSMNGSGNGTGSRASRRPHTKSRNGCGQCKKRKVKCDERAPRCSNCTKWRDLCDYELFGLPTCNPAGKRKQSKDAQSGAGMTISRSYPQPPAPSPSQINLEHLELMHHYSTSTARTFHDFGDGGHRWEIIVPGQAQSYEFLMHALLGVSALHIVHLKGNDPSASLYLSRARAHHSEALTLFRSTVSDITQINGIAAAAFSCLFLIFSCGTAQLADAAGNQEPVQDPIDTLFTIVGFFRSYWKLFDTSQQLVEARSPVARNSPSPGVDPQLVPNPAAAAALEELQQLNASSTDSDAMKTIYHDAIAQMQRSLDSGPALPRFLWPLTISDDYLALIEQRQPMALVILAHGCTLTKELPRRWFVHGWILNIILTISERVGSNWRARMQWPLEQCGLPLEIEHQPGDGGSLHELGDVQQSSSTQDLVKL